MDCATKCARYFSGEELKVCERDCNLKRCKIYKPYDDCVAARTVRDVLDCFERTKCRKNAEDCLKERCGIEVHQKPLDVKGS